MVRARTTRASRTKAFRSILQRKTISLPKQRKEDKHEDSYPHSATRLHRRTGDDQGFRRHRQLRAGAAGERSPDAAATSLYPGGQTAVIRESLPERRRYSLPACEGRDRCDGCRRVDDYPVDCGRIEFVTNTAFICD